MTSGTEHVLYIDSLTCVPQAEYLTLNIASQLGWIRNLNTLHAAAAAATYANLRQNKFELHRVRRFAESTQVQLVAAALLAKLGKLGEAAEQLGQLQQQQRDSAVSLTAALMRAQLFVSAGQLQQVGIIWTAAHCSSFSLSKQLQHCNMSSMRVQQA